nr:PE-PPE domain-containing protein [Gordonia asplenii]
MNPLQQQRISVLVVGGTGESGPDDRRSGVSGMLAHVTDNLDERFDAVWVGYPASYGPAPSWQGMAYEDSVAIGCENLAAAFAATGGRVMMLGYSQGAVVVRRFVARLARTEPAAVRRIVGVGLVADPHQPSGVVEGCHGSGVAGPDDASVSGADAVPAYWVGAADDVICNASADSLIRDIADLTGNLGVNGTAALGSWVTSMWATLRRNGFQNAARTAVSPAQWRRDGRRLVVAAREVAGYLPTVISWRGIRFDNDRGGRHTSYGVEPYRRHSLTDRDATGCEILARWLQVQATFVEYVVPVDDSARAAA